MKRNPSKEYFTEAAWEPAQFLRENENETFILIYKISILLSFLLEFLSLGQMKCN